MKLLNRNKITIYYSLCNGLGDYMRDENGHITGEQRISYEQPKEFRLATTYDRGETFARMFGLLESYDRILTTDDMECPIDESTILFVDKPPVMIDGYPQGDYKVVRVAKTLNYITYKIKKIDVDNVTRY